ncbi:phytanoyl-CoA dioxygenase family protein [Streptomyces sp. NPDC002521]
MVESNRLAARVPLTDGARQHYRKNGYVHFPGILSRDEVAEYRAAAEELVRKEGPELWGPEEEVQVHYVANAWRKHDLLKKLALHPVITGLASALAEVPLRLYSSDILLKKPRRALPTLVHDDETGLPMSNASTTLSAWIALVDVPEERGCLSFMPGSHSRADSECQGHMTSFANFVNIKDIWPDYAWRPWTTVPVRAGDVTFHHCRTVHRAGVNDTDEARIGYGVVYMDAGATYLPGVQDEHLHHLRPGQALDGPDFPLIEAG